MERHVSMDEISDGKRYRSSDMAKLGCKECEGCSACCHQVGDSIILDPWDIYMLTTHLNRSMESLLTKEIALGVVDGLILPHLHLESEETGCSFLNKDGRCQIHTFRPGICRLFPLGRIYEDGSFSYFLQTKECHIQNRTKVKISKWLGISELSVYEKFITDWHYFCKGIQDRAKEMEPETQKNCSMYVLQNFYLAPYAEEFYPEFYVRLEKAKNTLGIRKERE